MSEVASAYVSLLPSARNWSSKISGQIGGDVDKAGKASGSRFGKVFATASIKPFRAFGAAALGFFAIDKVKDFFASSMDEARESQKVSALTAQVIKSTGGAANVSAKQIGNLSSAISNKVGIDDEAIASGQNMLLTFKGIRDETGKGNKIFDQASRTMVDMAASMAAASGGQVDFKSSAIQLGKALNDPIKGITALSRVGVTFDDQQQKTIKSLVASGKTMDAQKIILKELRSEFGGAAAAQATASDKMKVAWGNLKEQIGTQLLPVVDRVENAITKKVIPAVGNFATAIQDKIAPAVGGAFKQAGKIAGSISDFFQTGAGHLPLVGAFDALKQHAKDTLDFIGQIKGDLGAIDLSNLDAGQLGQSLGKAVIDGLDYLGQNVAQITGAFASMLTSVDWVGLGIDIGKQAPALAIGFATGLLNVDIGSLFSQVMDHWWQVLVGVVAIMFAPAKFAGVLERVLARIPFAGKFLAAIVRGLQGLGDKVIGFAGDLAKSFGEGFGKIPIPGGAIVARVMAGLKGIPGAVGGFFSTLSTRIGVWALDAFKSSGAGARAGAGKMLSFVASLPGKIIGALGDVGGLLLGSGKALIEGFARGITDAASSAYNAAKGVVGKVRNLFPFSPAKEGPFSGKGYTTHSGKKLIQDFAVGIGAGGLAATLATRRVLERVNHEAKNSKLKKQLASIMDEIGDGLSGKGKKGKAQVQKVKDSLGKLTDAIKKQLDKQLQAAKDKVSRIADTISSLKDTIKQTASAVAQNYAPDFTTNTLFGPDGKMIKGTAVSSFKDQVAGKGSVLAQVTAAYKKLIGEGLNGDFLANLLQSGNNNLVLDLGAASRSDALSAQSMYQSVTAQADALGASVASHTMAAQKLADAEKDKAQANKELKKAQDREKKWNHLKTQIDKLDHLKKLDTLPKDISRELNQSIAGANKGRRS